MPEAEAWPWVGRQMEGGIAARALMPDLPPSAFFCPGRAEGAEEAEAQTARDAAAGRRLFRLKPLRR